MATNSSLHLIRPLGFSTDDKTLKRAGLDYWSELDVYYYDSYEDFAKKQEGQQIFFASTKAVKTYTEVSYSPNAFIVFGKESAGIPREILLPNLEHCIRIPMSENYRSLNLASSAAIVLYEALRQNDFAGLEREGLFREFM